MIARIWHGAVQTPRKDAYYDYMMKTGVPWYKSLEGNRGVLGLQKTSPETTDFLLLSFWDSMDAVRKFAGENPELAVYDFDEDKDFLLEMESKVDHYEIRSGFLSGGVPPRSGPTP